ncbi:MAG: hypothetical protein JW910_06325 [Anaerolineae bacterium]|nr:hypothetical protein [Anaerolineae bacterium]
MAANTIRTANTSTFSGTPPVPPSVPALRPLRWLAIPAVVLWLLLTGGVLIVAALPEPFDLAPVQEAFFPPVDECAPPCWAGIRPGVSTLDEALAVLAAHPWVGEITPRPEAGAILWTWRSGQLPLIDASADGELYYLADGTVETIILPTRVHWMAFHVLLGAPPTVQVARSWQQTAQSPNGLIARTLYLIYPAQGARLEVSWSCPVALADFRQAAVRLIYTTIVAPTSLNERLAPHCYENLAP